MIMKKNLKNLIEEITELTEDPWFRRWYETQDQHLEHREDAKGGSFDALSEAALADSSSG